MRMIYITISHYVVFNKISIKLYLGFQGQNRKNGIYLCYKCVNFKPSLIKFDPNRNLRYGDFEIKLPLHKYLINSNKQLETNMV